MASATASLNRCISFLPKTLLRRSTSIKRAKTHNSVLLTRFSSPLRPMSSFSPSNTVSKQLYLYNTMSRKKESFEPKDLNRVGMYVCGVTPYDFSHIGHARAYVTFDVLFRYLKYLGYNVCYVRNFTDVDDKIIARANKLNEDPLTLSARFIDEFHLDMASLNCLPPSHEPRVSTHITQIIDMINKIIENGCGYVVGSDVYYSVDKFPFYGKLSGRSLEDNRAGERVAVDQRKKNPFDFALWKAAKQGEPSWDSPWGPGRPGWHIECSAMSHEYLGPTFDIHGGGQDLVFPHHDNEIAQTCAACKDNESRVRFWVHNGFVNVDSQKMSKSLNNFKTIREVIEVYHPLALRFFLLGTHYRTTINYSREQLDTASDRLFYIYQTLRDCEEILSAEEGREISEDSLPNNTLECIEKLYGDFVNCMCDDLHTAMVLSALSDPLKLLNDLLHTRKGKKQERRIESVFSLEKRVRNILSVLGLMPSSYSEVLQQLREKALKRAGLTESQVLERIEERNLARKNKNYTKSDEIRKELAVVGIALMDDPDGTTWRPAVPLDAQTVST